MAKKDFSGKANPVLNPALRFITGATQAVEEIMEEPAEAKPEALVAIADATAVEPKVAAELKAAKGAQKEKPAAIAEPERKSKRLNLLILPSVLENLSKIATMQQTSVNDLINNVLKAYAEDNPDTIRQYDRVFGKPPRPKRQG